MKTKSFRSGIVSKLTGMSYDRIDYYDRHGIVSPDIARAHGPGSRRQYSRDNLAELNVLRKLMDRGVTLGKVRKLLSTARSLFPAVKKPLRDLPLLTDGSTVYARSPRTNELVDLLDASQPVFEAMVVETTEPLDSSIHEIDAADIDVLSVGDRLFLVELVEEADGKGVVARCPDVYGISVKGRNADEALARMRDHIRETQAHLH